MEEIRSLKGIGIDELFEVFSEAFKDYERTWNKEEIEKTLYRRAYVPELSFGAFDENRLVSFTFNGIGTFNGLLTAYDTGTGTIPGYRGKGLATKIFQKSVPYLKEAGALQYLLEVLQHNSKAVSVYTNIGFKINREFNYFVQEVNEIKSSAKTFTGDYQIREIGFDLKEQMMKMWDYSPAWQNTFTAICKKPEHFKVIGAFNGDKLIGYGIVEPLSGDIPQLAIDRDQRRKGIATVILKELLILNAHPTVKVVNTDVSCEAITDFLSANTIPLSGKQFEMIKEL